MRFNLLALALPLTLSMAAHAAPQPVPGPVVGASAAAPAVEKIIGDLMARLIPQVLSSISQPEVNIQRMSIKFGNTPGSTQINALNGNVRVGLTQAFEYALISESDLKVEGVPGLNTEMMKDFIPVVKIGPAQTIVGLDFNTLSQPNSAINVIQSKVGFQGSRGENALKIQIGSKKFNGISVKLRSITATLTLSGEIVMVSGICDAEQEVAKLGFVNGKVQVVNSSFQNATCGFSMTYSIPKKEYAIGLEYSSQTAAAPQAR